MENAKLAGKLGLDVGAVSSIINNLDNETITRSNDGDPNIYAVRDGQTFRGNRDLQMQYGKRYLANPVIPAYDRNKTGVTRDFMESADVMRTDWNIDKGLYR